MQHGIWVEESEGPASTLFSGWINLSPIIGATVVSSSRRNALLQPPQKRKAERRLVMLRAIHRYHEYHKLTRRLLHATRHR